MSWIQVRRTAGRSGGTVTLSIARRRRNRSTAYVARLGLPATVLQQLGLSVGDHVALFLGREENRGKLALRKADRLPDSFRLTRYGTGASVAFSADLLDLPAPMLLERQAVASRIAADMLELTLPAQLDAAAAPLRPADADRSGGFEQRNGAEAAGAAGAPGPRAKYGEAWTAEDDAELRRMRLAGLPKGVIAAALGRTPASVALRVSKLRIPKGGAPAGGEARPLPAAPAAAPSCGVDQALVAEALDWLRRDGMAVERLDGGFFCIDGERVTPLRLVQIANDRKARRSLPTIRPAGAAQSAKRPD